MNLSDVILNLVDRLLNEKEQNLILKQQIAKCQDDEKQENKD